MRNALGVLAAVAALVVATACGSHDAPPVEPVHTVTVTATPYVSATVKPDTHEHGPASNSR